MDNVDVVRIAEEIVHSEHDRLSAYHGPLYTIRENAESLTNPQFLTKEEQLGLFREIVINARKCIIQIKSGEVESF